MRAIQVNRRQCKGFQCPASQVRSLFRRLDQVADYTLAPGDLSLAFLPAAVLAQVHHDFLGDPAPTDVITFPGDPSDGLAGEICVSVDRAQEVARQKGLDPAHELTLYLVHGWLHLVGLDDHTPEQRREMRAAEKKMMAKLVQEQMIPDFTFQQ